MEQYKLKNMYQKKNSSDVFAANTNTFLNLDSMFYLPTKQRNVNHFIFVEKT